MPELTMPRLSDTMQEGTLARWLKQPGDRVEKGEVVAEIETDKATMELESYDSGILEKILVNEGQTVPIGQPIAVVGEGGQESGVGRSSPKTELSLAQGGESGVRRQESGAEAHAATEPAPSLGARAPSPAPADQRGTPSTSEAAQQTTPTPDSQLPTPDEVRASPMARAVARERGIDLRAIQGSGPGGRVIRADVEAAANGHAAAAPQPQPQPATQAQPRPSAAEPQAAPVAQQPAPTPGSRPPTPAEDVEELPLTNMRRVVARRMLESVQSAPHFYLTSVVDADELVRFREQLNNRGGEAELKISLNDLLVKACASALRSHPDVNVSFAGDKILRFRRVHLGIAVALEGGLIVPVIRDADQKSLGQISREAKALIARARAGKLTPPEFSGSTFSISNLGMFGIDHFTAVINPPEAAILAVGATTPEPVVRDNQVAIRQTLKLTLSIDHRALDGATAARFLQDLKTLLEDPLRIVV